MRRWRACSARAVGGLLALVACACGNGGEAPPPEDELVFPTDVRGAGYVEVRACRSPGEHSALSAYSVWVDAASADAFAALWDAPGTAAMPDGSTIVKELYDDTDCTPEAVSGWAVMQKRAGFDAEGGDWYWQWVGASGLVTTDGKDTGCTGCHQGIASCTGYGDDAGLDYLCTAP